MGPDPSSSLDLAGGTILADRYRIIKKLGEGGMGTVYLAEHTTINKRLAIKVLSPEFSHKQDLVDRFLQEARAASMIDQENVVEITDFGSTPGGSVFFVMEFLQGEDLSDTIKSAGSLQWARVKPIMLQICEALAAAHDVGIIHRDMKPENCFRIKRGTNHDFIKVLDFGIAKVTSDEGESKNLTRTGMIFGTPEYMSPEQAKGEKVDHRVDVYATGVILYELVTGRVPFTADTFMGILTKHMFEAPPAPSTVVPTAAIPVEVEAIVLKALQKDREYRFQSMREMADAIRAVGTGSAAVSVVAEQVSRPTSGQIRFAGRAAGTTNLDLEEELPKKSNVGLFVGLGVFAAVLVGGAVMVAMTTNQEDPTAIEEAPAVAAAPTPEVDEAEDEAPEIETPVPVPIPTAAPPVQITVVADGIDGKVFDNRDDSVLGKTNEPFTIPSASEPLDVYVSADGYEDQIIELVPDADKSVVAKMSKLDAGTPKKKRPRPKKPKPKPKPKPEADKPKPEADKPKPEADTPKPKPKGNSDLKDPFAGGG